MMRIVAIVQARMGSTRLPGKVLMDLAGEPMVARVLARVRAIRGIDDVVLATSVAEDDRRIVDAARARGYGTFTGSEDDVLDRYYDAAVAAGADVVMRVTADCPFIDPEVSGLVLNRYLEGDVDFVSNVLPPTYPDGLDTWVFSMEALRNAWQNARLPSEREHVTPYIWNTPGRFRIANVTSPVDHSERRWTVDHADDLELVRGVYSELLPVYGPLFTMNDIIDVLARKPALGRDRSDRIRDEGYLKSLRQDQSLGSDSQHRARAR